MIRTTLLLLMLSLTGLPAFAQQSAESAPSSDTSGFAETDSGEDEGELESGEAPISREVQDSAEEKPLDLGSLEVVGEGVTFEQEFTLRLLKNALGNSRSRKRKDRDEWVCWIEKATGSSFKYLNCARNGDLWALERPFGLAGPTVPSGGYGTIMRTERPVNSHKLKQILASLEGPEGFDEEFVALVVQGKRPPRDIPDESELDAFARAYESVGRLQARGASEQRQIRAIEAEGLSLKRYNHIAGLSENYQTIENDIAARLE